MTLREWTFAECATARGTRRAALDVVSPLYFSRGGRDHPAPDAVLIARSLLDRWDDHAPPGLAAPAAARRHLLDTVYLVEFAGRTQRIPVGTATRQTGFVGSMTLALTRAADDTTAALFAALLRFAEVAGVGAQTGYGFGAVTVRIPDRPHGPRRVARRVATVGNV